MIIKFSWTSPDTHYTEKVGRKFCFFDFFEKGSKMGFFGYFSILGQIEKMSKNLRLLK